MPENIPPRQTSALEERRQGPNSGGAPPPDFSELPPEKRDLAKKLENVGVWVGRIADLLSRYSARRIRANFELYRRRAAEKTIRRPGAWLYEAISEGYALPGAESGPEDGNSTEESSSRPALGHKEIVSEAKKDAYVAGGLPEERFHRCLSPDNPASEPQFMYFSPEEGGPERQVYTCR